MHDLKVILMLLTQVRRNRRLYGPQQLFEYTEGIRTKAIMKAVEKADEMY